MDKKMLFLLLAAVFIIMFHSGKDHRAEEKTIYLAGGCFWGTEHYMKTIDGVLSTKAGYILGKKQGEEQRLGDKVTYEEVCGGSGHAEGVEVVFDPDRISINELLQEYAYTIEPTLLNRQGGDVGIQYRTGIYSLTDEQKKEVDYFLTELQKDYDQPVVVENLPILQFIPAEEYHQNYLEKNPFGYCHIDFKKIAELKKEKEDAKKYKRKTKAELKDILTPLQFDVTQKNATERPFENEYWETQKRGIYVDITTGEPLFSSKDKFLSSCGWPTFSKPISPDLLIEKEDASAGMERTEVRSRVGDSHLGHVFDDGPEQLGGLRYCINSASLVFIPEEEMEKEGYGDYLPFLY